MRFRLGKEDRERLGLPDDWIEHDETQLSARELVRLQKLTGLTLEDIKDESAIFEVWRSLRNAGHEYPYDSFDFNLYGIEHDNEEPGKA